MKYYNTLWLSAVALFMMASCAEESKLDFSVNQPDSLANLEYLNEYSGLKSYVDPAIKLGAGVLVDDFTSKARGYSLVVSNFNEVTARSEMNHKAVVQGDGSLKLTNVEKFVSTAKDASLSVFGHSLIWFANQNSEYLNKKIAPDVIPSTGGSALEASVITGGNFENGAAGWGGWGGTSTRGLSASGEGFGGTGFAYTFTNPTAGVYYSVQTAYELNPALQLNSTYVLKFKVKANAVGTIRAEVQTPTDYSSDGFGTFDISAQWKEYSLEVIVKKDTRTRFLISHGDFVGTVFIDDITLQRVNPSAGGVSGKFVVADFEANALGTTYPMTNNGSGTVATDPQGTGNVLKIVGAQTHPKFTVTLPAGVNLGNCTQIVLDFLGTGSTGMYGTGMKVSLNDGALVNYGSPSSFGAADNVWLRGKIILPISTLALTEAQKLLTSFTLAVGSGTGSANYYIDNVTLDWKVSGDLLIEKTPEVKKQIITDEMEKWIKGMLDVTKSSIKAWNVVNDPMDDANPTQLKTGVGKKFKADTFFWQDYMGKDYAVQAFKFAAQYGNADDKLFINDNNLESNLAKCDGLIEYVNYIVSQGGRVDGIGTQMHISLATDKAKIDEMFTKLAQTGKLIRISELYCSVNKETRFVTDEDYKAQADMYNYVIKKYFEIIPASQRYGITFWNPLDKSNEAIGLWNEGYSRKRAYGGAAAAFEGK